MKAVGNILKYRDFNIEVDAVDEYGTYYNTAKLEIYADGYINGVYYYSESHKLETIEDAVKWVDTHYDETL